MKLILTRDVANLGEPGDIVDVRGGYGRNYLIPKGLAIVWSKGTESQIDKIKRARTVREVRDLGHAKELKGELEGLKVAVTARAGDTGQLFGRVTAKEVTKAIKKAGGPDVDWHRLDVAEPIKHVGEHVVTIDLHPDVTASVQLNVAAAE